MSQTVKPKIMSNNFTLRPIEKRDNAALAQMIRSVFEEHDAPTEGTVYTDPTTDDLFGLFIAASSHL